MAMPSRGEVEAAFAKYLDTGAFRRDWNAWAHLFTEDAVYHEVQDIYDVRASLAARAAFRAAGGNAAPPMEKS